MPNIKISADYRERQSGIPGLLIEKGVDISIDELPAGDYLINENILVERKTKNDFVLSLINNRLFNQCSKLKRSLKNLLFIIEGNPYKTTHNISYQAVKGALLSISLAWQIPVFFSKDTDDTSEILISAGKQMFQDKIPVLRKSYKPKKPRNQQLYFLQGLPSIGPLLAIRLIEYFRSIDKIMNASYEELMLVEGIGKVKARKIKEFIN
jgi:Fanconi anemia group M protein